MHASLANAPMALDALLRQCDALEAQLRQTCTLGSHLLNFALHHRLAK